MVTTCSQLVRSAFQIYCDALTTMLVAVPTGIKIFKLTMTGGSIVLDAYDLGFRNNNYLHNEVTGIILASILLDIALHDAFFVVAHFHYVLVEGQFFSFIGGVYYCCKMTGKMMNEKLGLLLLYFFIFFKLHSIQCTMLG